MTAAVHPAPAVTHDPAHTPSAASRIWGTVRIQYLNRYTFVWIPLIILASAVAVSIAIYAMIGADQPMYGGAVQAPLWYFVAAGAQAMSLTFPFAQALTVTRREFFLGTALAALISAGGLSLVFVVLGYIEQATNGYGVAISLGVVVVGAIFIVTRFELWGDVLSLFADLGPLGVTGYVSILVALAALAGWLTLRRSTP